MHFLPICVRSFLFQEFFMAFCESDDKQPFLLALITRPSKKKCAIFCEVMMAGVGACWYDMVRRMVVRAKRVKDQYLSL